MEKEKENKYDELSHGGLQHGISFQATPLAYLQHD
jgi:hypothetical protein